MRSQGQLSLEFLLLLAAACGVFLIALPAMRQVHNDALQALDRENAGRFAAMLQQRADEMAFLGDGSRASVEASPFTEWAAYSEGKDFFIAGGSGGAAQWEQRVRFPNDIAFKKTFFSEKTVFVLEKKGGAVHLYTTS